jgi:hypothetical protein
MATYVLRFLSVQRCNRVDTCAERPEKRDSLKNRHNVNTWVLKLYHLFAAKNILANLAGKCICGPTLFYEAQL